MYLQMQKCRKINGTKKLTYFVNTNRKNNMKN